MSSSDNDEQRSDAFFWGFYEALEDQPDLQTILECFLDGVVKPRNIAAKLNVNVKDVYNARKRLATRLTAYREGPQKTNADGEARDA